MILYFFFEVSADAKSSLERYQVLTHGHKMAVTTHIAAQEIGASESMAHSSQNIGKSGFKLDLRNYLV